MKIVFIQKNTTCKAIFEKSIFESNYRCTLTDGRKIELTTKHTRGAALDIMKRFKYSGDYIMVTDSWRHI